MFMKDMSEKVVSYWHWEDIGFRHVNRKIFSGYQKKMLSQVGKILSCPDVRNLYRANKINFTVPVLSQEFMFPGGKLILYKNSLDDRRK